MVRAERALVLMLSPDLGRSGGRVPRTRGGVNKLYYRVEVNASPWGDSYSRNDRVETDARIP